MIFGIFVNLISAIHLGGSSYNTFGIVYQIQILMLLPLIGIDFGEDVIDFYRYIKEILFTFAFIPDDVVFYRINIFDDYHYPQNNWFLYLLGMGSRSSLVNTTKLLLVVSIVGVVTIIITLFYFSVSYQRSERNCPKIFSKLLKYSLTAIVSLMLLTLVFLLMTSLNEIIEINSVLDETISYAYSSLIVVY